MKKKMKTISVWKERNKRKLFSFETEIISLVSDSIVYAVPKRKILKDIQELIERFSSQIRLTASEKKYLYSVATEVYKKVYEKVSMEVYRVNKKKGLSYSEKTSLKKEVVYVAVRRAVLDKHDVSKATNKVANHIEARQKDETIEYMLEKGAEVKSPYYLCSVHKEPAKDHAKYQGKIYIDRNWKDYIVDKELRYKISMYNRNHNVRSVQYIIGEPVYLIRRPNCKHFFIPIPIDEVLTSSARALVRRHEVIGEQEAAPMSDAQYVLRAYERDLKRDKALYDSIPTDGLEKDIAREKMLVRKWRRKTSRA